jgi:hypothetical protein
MSGFDFLEEVEDSNGAPETKANDPELLEEDAADDSSDEGAQDELPAEDESDEAEDDEELEFVDLDGEEVTLDQIREWKRGTLREQDYTKKTQALADERKALSDRMTEVDSIASTLTGVEDEIKALLVADLDDIDMKQLRKDDYEEYSRLKEERAEREEQINSLKKKAVEARQKLVAQEQADLSKSLGWDDSKKQASDVEAFNALAKDLGLSSRDMTTLTSAKVMGALIELANIKKTKTAQPPKAERKKVKIGKKRSTQPAKAKPRSLEDELDSIFN